MILGYFHLLYFKSILLANFTHQLFRSLSYRRILKYRLPPLWTPHQVVRCVVDRMTRPLQSHASFYYNPFKDLCGLGRLRVSLITLCARHAFIPRGKPRGILQSLSVKKGGGGLAPPVFCRYSSPITDYGFSRFCRCRLLITHYSLRAVASAFWFFVSTDHPSRITVFRPLPLPVTDHASPITVYRLPPPA